MEHVLQILEIHTNSIATGGTMQFTAFATVYATQAQVQRTHGPHSKLHTSSRVHVTVRTLILYKKLAFGACIDHTAEILQTIKFRLYLQLIHKQMPYSLLHP